MFVFEDPSDLNDDWYLGDKNKFKEKIPINLLKNISNGNIISIQFLFENFFKKRRGAILNQDNNFNMPLQVCAFLSIVKDKIDKNSPVLIVTSEYSFCKWHYHASEAGFEPKIITPFDSEYVDHVYLLDSEALKLAENLLSFNLFCVIIDNFDELATKLFIKKLRGTFNIGLTQRNFYKHPDQKLKWTMLNWANPGCVGKLADFYRIDRQHFLAFADNYRYWWMRLTSKFCDSFESPTEDYLEEYQQKLQEWGEIHDIIVGLRTKLNLKRSNSNKKGHENKRLKSEYSSTSSYLPNENISIPSPSSQKTLKYDLEPEDIDVKMVLSMRDSVKDSSVEQKDNTDTFFQDDTRKISKDVRHEKNEPLLSVIYSNTSHEIEDSTIVNVSSKTDCNDSMFFSCLISDESTECERIKSDRNISNNPSEFNSGGDSDDDSFFSKFILGKE